MDIPVFDRNKCSISFSRSTTSFRATDCTRPAESPPRGRLVPASQDRRDLIADDPVEKAVVLAGHRRGPDRCGGDV